MADGAADAAVPAPSGRETALHYAAYNGSISAGAELLVGGADQRITNKKGYRRAAHKPRRRAAHADRCRKTPRQLAQQYNTLGAYDAAVAQARPPHRCAPPAACAPLAAAGIVTHATDALARRGMPRPRSSAYADEPAA